MVVALYIYVAAFQKITHSHMNLLLYRIIVCARLLATMAALLKSGNPTNVSRKEPVANPRVEDDVF